MIGGRKQRVRKRRNEDTMSSLAWGSIYDTFAQSSSCPIQLDSADKMDLTRSTCILATCLGTWRVEILQLLYLQDSSGARDSKKPPR